MVLDCGRRGAGRKAGSERTSHRRNRRARHPETSRAARAREDTRLNRKTATFEFHVSRRARDRYQLDDTFFTLTGNVVFANFRAARVFAQKMNEQRDLVNYPEQAVKPGQINALGLVDEVMHYLVGLYRQEQSADSMARALSHLEDRLGRETLDKTLRAFADGFPTVAV